jgi:hypothetical protein
VTPTGIDGIARFARVRPGVYTAAASGYGPAEVRVTEDESAPVVLRPLVTGTLRVRFPGGEEVVQANARTNIASAGGALMGVVAHVEPGEEMFVDLAPSETGRLIVRGAESWTLERRIEGAVIFFRAAAGGDSFPPGRYQLRAGLARRELEVVAGEVVEIDLGTDLHTLTGRVTFADGSPAHGAEVSLGWGPVPVDPSGVFRIEGVPAGEYECTAQLQGFFGPVAHILVAGEGVATSGLPIVLRPKSGARIRLTGLGNEPLPGVLVRVDGREAESDLLGEIELPGPAATLDLDLAGFASIRGRRVRDRETVRLVRGATLVVLFDVPRERLEVRVDGETWRALDDSLPQRRQTPGRLILTDLPPGEVEVEILPDPDAEPAEDEDPEAEPEPDVSRIRLRSGAESTLDLRG